LSFEFYRERVRRANLGRNIEIYIGNFWWRRCWYGLNGQTKKFLNFEKNFNWQKWNFEIRIH